MSKLVRAAVAAGLVVVATAAFAGAKFASPVTIYSLSGTPRGAYGAMGSARNSADTQQYITCQVDLWYDGLPSVWCWARDASGATLSCNSTDPDYVQLALGADGDSSIHFEVASGKCVYLAVRTSSYWEPKQ